MVRKNYSVPGAFFFSVGILGLSLIFLGFTIVSCATMNVTLNHKQAAAWMNNIYAAQYDDYLTWFDVVGTDVQGKPIYKLKANVPEKQKKILKTKKTIFAELQPLLNQYSAYAATGIKTPLIDTAIDRAVELVNKLIQGGSE